MRLTRKPKRKRNLNPRTKPAVKRRKSKPSSKPWKMSATISSKTCAVRMPVRNATQPSSRSPRHSTNISSSTKSGKRSRLRNPGHRRLPHPISRKSRPTTGSNSQKPMASSISPHSTKLNLDKASLRFRGVSSIFRISRPSRKPFSKTSVRPSNTKRKRPYLETTSTGSQKKKTSTCQPLKKLARTSWSTGNGTKPWRSLEPKRQASWKKLIFQRWRLNLNHSAGSVSVQGASEPVADNCHFPL